MTRSREDVLRLIDEADIHYVRLCFTDILGRMKGMSITRREMEQVLDEGQGFDGSSVEGFARIEESDLMAVPDPVTFRIIPWDVAGERVAMMFCDITNTDGTPYEGDPRWVLKRNLARLKERNWTYYVGPEMEYFYFQNREAAGVLDGSGYFDYDASDVGSQVRKASVAALEAMDIPVECSHHEVAPSQHEIDLKYQEALVMADFVQFFRWVIKEVAMQNEVYATFMPKPIMDVNGSGMHCHQSLFNGERNLFFDQKGKYNLSKMARQYAAGLLTHVSEITLVLNQWVNSYKRLVPGYEAPVYVSWGQRNRSSMVRVPAYRAGREQATRIELRSPDPSTNPYLAFACMASAGLKGVDNAYELPEPIEENIFHLTQEKKSNLKIDTLPGSLHSAIEAFEKSELARETLGDHIFNALILNKRIEWDNYRVHVSQYEVDKYLGLL